MTIFRWGIGILAALFTIAALGSLVIFLTSDLQHWLRRARRLRRWAWLACLVWFNVEVWGRVVYTLVHWNG
jgi:predicted PurR-regulated permease PerM